MHQEGGFIYCGRLGIVTDTRIKDLVPCLADAHQLTAAGSLAIFEQPFQNRSDVDKFGFGSFGGHLHHKRIQKFKSCVAVKNSNRCRIILVILIDLGNSKDVQSTLTGGIPAWGLRLISAQTTAFCLT